MPEISALGVFFNFDNERMHPPKYLSDPPGEKIFWQRPKSTLTEYSHTTPVDLLYGTVRYESSQQEGRTDRQGARQALLVSKEVKL